MITNDGNQTGGKPLSSAAESYQTNHSPLSWAHAVGSTLKGKKGLVEYYETYSHPKLKDSTSDMPSPIAVAVVKIGNQLDGPVGAVHGGIVALMFDDVMGFAAHSVLPWVVTRDLSVEYKSPQPHEQYVVIRVYYDDEKMAQYAKDSKNKAKNGMKKRVFLRATCRSLGRNTIETAPFSPDEGTLYSTATITMVQVQRPPSAREAEVAFSYDVIRKQPPNILQSKL